MDILVGKLYIFVGKLIFLVEKIKPKILVFPEEKIKAVCGCIWDVEHVF